MLERWGCWYFEIKWVASPKEYGMLGNFGAKVEGLGKLPLLMYFIIHFSNTRDLFSRYM